MDDTMSTHCATHDILIRRTGSTAMLFRTIVLHEAVRRSRVEVHIHFLEVERRRTESVCHRMALVLGVRVHGQIDEGIDHEIIAAATEREDGHIRGRRVFSL